MFNQCHKLKEINGLYKFNTNQVTKMNSMFQYCNELVYLDLSNFDTSKVNEMNHMFSHCFKLKEVTWFVLNLFIPFISFNLLQLLNINDILVTFEVLKLDKSKFSIS